MLGLIIWRFFVQYVYTTGCIDVAGGSSRHTLLSKETDEKAWGWPRIIQIQNIGLRVKKPSPRRPGFNSIIVDEG